MVGKSVSKSMIRRHTKRPRPVTFCFADLDEQVLMPNFSDDALERAGGRTHNQALTLGFCTFNLIECPIGSRA
jgi:hypothetical protein